jgi:nucleotide-binding universal stress UspA family protein
MNSVEAPIRRIVVGVDGSEPSIEALRQAQRLAQPLGAEVMPLRSGIFRNSMRDMYP